MDEFSTRVELRPWLSYLLQSIRSRDDVSGLPADGTTKLQGFHIHQSGDMLGVCESIGSRYNPFGSVHDAPETLIVRIP